MNGLERGQYPSPSSASSSLLPSLPPDTLPQAFTGAQFHPYSYPSFTYNSYTPSTAASHFAGRKWCEQNGLEADKGTGRPQRPKDSGKKKAKKAGNKKVKGTREVKPLPTRTIARRRASLASMSVNIIA